MRSIRVVMCTGPDTVVRALAHRLVDARLAACVNLIGGVTSVYRWEGRVSEDPESLMIIKTTADAVEDLTRMIVEQHGYQVPEVLVLPVNADEGNPAYLEWLADSVGEGSGNGG